MTNIQFAKISPKLFRKTRIRSPQGFQFQAKLIEEMNSKCFMEVKVWDHRTSNGDLVGIYSIPAANSGRAKYVDLEAKINGWPIF